MMLSGLGSSEVAPGQQKCRCTIGCTILSRAFPPCRACFESRAKSGSCPQLASRTFLSPHLVNAARMQVSWPAGAKTTGSI